MSVYVLLSRQIWKIDCKAGRKVMVTLQTLAVKNSGLSTDERKAGAPRRVLRRWKWSAEFAHKGENGICRIRFDLGWRLVEKEKVKKKWKKPIEFQPSWCKSFVSHIYKKLLPLKQNRNQNKTYTFIWSQVRQMNS